MNASDGQDVVGGAASVPMAGGTPGHFQYAQLSSPVTLSAYGVYFVVSEETAGGDLWCNLDSSVTTRAVATDTGGVYGTGPHDWVAISAPDRSFGPVDFKY